MRVIETHAEKETRRGRVGEHSTTAQKNLINDAHTNIDT